MTVRTLSESVFEYHCTTRRISFVKLEEGVAPTPDYEIQSMERSIFVEVKQLDQNRNDQLRETLDSCLETGLGLAPVRRVRQKVADAYKQIRQVAAKGSPCIIALYNNAGLMNFIDEFTVTKSMFGSPQVYFRIHPDGFLRFAGTGFGPGRKLTRNTCRGISAICVLEDGSTARTHVTLYHNPFAQNPLEPSEISRFADRQFVYDTPGSIASFGISPRLLEV